MLLLVTAADAASVESEPLASPRMTLCSAFVRSTRWRIARQGRNTSPLFSQNSCSLPFFGHTAVAASVTTSWRSWTASCRVIF